jgi:hypothetical protein
MSRAADEHQALLLPRAEAAPPAAPRGGAPPPAAHWATSRRVALALVAGVLALAACASATTRGLVDPAPVLARLGARNRVRRVDERDAAIDAPASPPRDDDPDAAPTSSARRSRRSRRVDPRTTRAPAAAPRARRPRLTVEHSHMGNGPEAMFKLTTIPRAFVRDAYAAALKSDVPPREEEGAIVSTLGRRERGANENRSSSGDAAAAIEPEPRALTADVFAITLGGARDLEGSDAEKKRRIVGAFAASYGVEQTRRRARLLPGVVAADWPRDEKFADYALRDVRRRLDGEEGKLRELPWIDHFTVRDEATGGLVRDEHWPEHFDHHVGCLFAHMFAWQLARDARSRAALVLESDGVDAANLAVPIGSLQFAIDEAPADFDVLFVNKLEDPRLDRRFPWRSDLVKTAMDAEARGDGGPVTIDFFRYRNPFAAGISGYVVSDRFLEKIAARIAERGADMVDAWMYKLCGDALEYGSDGKPLDPDATALRCYSATERSIVERYAREHPEGP